MTPPADERTRALVDTTIAVMAAVLREALPPEQRAAVARRLLSRPAPGESAAARAYAASMFALIAEELSRPDPPRH